MSSTKPEYWASVSQAIAAPIALSTMGLVIISSVFVVHQLRSQHQNVQTQYQPVVTCAAVLDYTMKGMNHPAKVQISEPKVLLRLKNLGDSPALLIDITVTKFVFHPAKGKPHDLMGSLSSHPRHIDHLGQNDWDENSGSGVREIPLSEILPDAVTNLVDGLLTEGGDQLHCNQHLECVIKITHRNIMALKYDSSCRFVWSTGLAAKGGSEHAQLDYIRKLRAARAASERIEPSIGHLLRVRRPLQALVYPHRRATFLPPFGPR
jgi:hypothetical protein